MLPLEIEVVQVNGPYVSYLPPAREGKPEKIYIAEMWFIIEKIRYILEKEVKSKFYNIA